MLSIREPLEKRLSTLTSYPLAGSCIGRFAFHQVDSNFLTQLLPSGLSLAPQNYAPPGFHPLLLMFNYTHLHSNLNLPEVARKAGLGLKLNYNEFIVMLPFVHLNAGDHNPDKVYCYLPVLYLDSLLAVLGGRIFWEFNKVPAHFIVNEQSFTIKKEVFGGTYFTSTFGTPGAGIPARSNENFIKIEPILNLPVVEFGHEGYISSEYKIAYENAAIRPCTSRVNNISCDFLPAGIMEIPSITDNVMGAFFMDYNWELTWATKI